MMEWPYRIASVVADPKSFTLRLVWQDGTTTIKDMRPLIEQDAIFRPLADPALFCQVRIIEGGFGLEWNDEIDYCADALWYEEHPEDNLFVEDVAAAQ